MSTRLERYARELGGRVERLGGLRRRLELEVVEHLEDAAASYRERGLSPAEAEERAVRDFGAPELIARQLLEDLAVSLRALLAAPRAAATPA
ncbi:MAG TPA: permease prefix domain 1-containing protein [Candidatus Eisenbacteria bacterium]|nr:permease prefix domain 1-containing protein [Candidatus Eisenbacteria bacterium]